jgi:hypothetical protein
MRLKVVRVLQKVSHTIYRKLTQTNLYLNSSSHHHPSIKQPLGYLWAVLSTLVHRAGTLFDCEGLHDELEFFSATFRQNGYSDQQI